MLEAACSHGLVGYDARLTRERSRVRASVRILCPFFRTTLHFGCVFDFVTKKRSKTLNVRPYVPPKNTQNLHFFAFVFFLASLFIVKEALGMIRTFIRGFHSALRRSKGVDLSHTSFFKTG